MSCWRSSIRQLGTAVARWACALVVVGLATLSLAAQERPRPSAPADLRERAREIVEANGLQRELPTDPVEAKLDDLPDIPEVGWLETILRLVLHGGLVGAAVLIAVWLASSLDRPNGPMDVAEMGAAAEAGAIVATSLDEADALAAAGRLAEAVHALLLLAIDELTRRASLTLPPAITARELADLLQLDPARESTYTRLVRVAELVLFGGRPARPETYQDAREDYLELVA